MKHVISQDVHENETLFPDGAKLWIIAETMNCQSQSRKMSYKGWITSKGSYGVSI